MDDQRTDREGGADVTDYARPYLSALRDQTGKWMPLSPDAAATFVYHVLADAVFWSDEFPPSISPELENAFRLVINHRTSLLLDEQARFQDVWDVAKEC